MKLYKRIISGFLAIAIAISLSVPVFAVDLGNVVGAMSVAPDFGSWLWSAIKTGNSTYKWLTGDTDYCPGSGNQPGFNARHDFVPRDTVVNGKSGTFYICENCGLSAGEVLAPAYDNYVSALPAQGYTSSGGFIWYPTVMDISHFWPNLINGAFDKDTLDSSSRSFSISLRTDRLTGQHQLYYSVPFNGTYKLHDSLVVGYRYLGNDGIVFGVIPPKENAESAYKSSGETLMDQVIYPGYSPYFPSADSLVVYSYTLSSFEVIPETAIPADTYNTTTRPTSISGGNYGIVGDNNQITKVEDNSSIVNETNNTYFNPATGQTAPITNWSYDYSDRSYKVNLEGGKTSSVTYGDENITITETTVNESGDTITNNYTIYYLIDGSGSENPPSTCEHTWTETSSTPATCIMPGSRLSTCSKCQQTKKESIPALGHDWQEKQTVTTQYDETGQLVQKGYTIYECSRCHEQYKSEDGTGPPDTPPENPGEEEEKQGFFAWLWSVFTDALKKLVEGVVDAILKTLDFFFGGDSQSNYDFYNSPSTFSGVSVWAS